MKKEANLICHLLSRQLVKMFYHKKNLEIQKVNLFATVHFKRYHNSLYKKF